MRGLLDGPPHGGGDPLMGMPPEEWQRLLALMPPREQQPSIQTVLNDNPTPPTGRQQYDAFLMQPRNSDLLAGTTNRAMAPFSLPPQSMQLIQDHRMLEEVRGNDNRGGWRKR